MSTDCATIAIGLDAEKLSNSCACPGILSNDTTEVAGGPFENIGKSTSGGFTTGCVTSNTSLNILKCILGSSTPFESTLACKFAENRTCRGKRADVRFTVSELHSPLNSTECKTRDRAEKE